MFYADSSLYFAATLKTQQTIENNFINIEQTMVSLLT